MIGVLFSGYLSFTKLVLGSCSLREGCPYFLGYPACVYGLIIFLILFIASLALFFRGTNYHKTMKTIYFVSLVGILFSTYTSIKELVYPSCLNGVCDYSLLLPTCIYGLIMYLVIFVSSFLALRK